MLSYKYYKANPDKSNTPTALKAVNQAIRESFTATLNAAMKDLKTPTNIHTRRYNIWDNIGEYADDIILRSGISLPQIDQIFMAKLLSEFRGAPMIHPGLEYYCLLQINKLHVFRTTPQLSDIAARISYFISKHYRASSARSGANYFARNVRKIQIIKRAYGSRTILRSTWSDIYQCYKFGKQALTEELNQNDILSGIGLVTQNSPTTKSVVIDIIPDEDLVVCDIESETESLPGTAEYGIGNEDVLHDSQIVDSNRNHNDSPTAVHYTSDIENEHEEPETHVLEPDEW